MKKNSVKRTVVVGSAMLLLGAMGCAPQGNQSRTSGYVGALDTGNRQSAAQIRSEEDMLTHANWQQVEELLGQKGYHPGRIDGYVTQETRDAIANYQQHNRIRATGLLDDRTLIYMNRDGAGFTGTLQVQLDKASRNPTLGGN
jgi:peptidoglycan hydrolase-like protein with peptidoglycan-binding domain